MDIFIGSCIFILFIFVVIYAVKSEGKKEIQPNQNSVNTLYTDAIREIDIIDEISIYQDEYLLVNKQTYHFVNISISWVNGYLKACYKGNLLGYKKFTRYEFNEINNQISLYKKSHSKNTKEVVVKKSTLPLADNKTNKNKNYVAGIKLKKKQSKYKDITINIGDGVFIHKSAEDQESSDLMKQATEQAGNDINGAISSLRKASKLMDNGDTIASYLRLPLYLQKAGSYNESINEFEKLLDNATKRNAEKFAHQPKNKQEYFCALERATIYDKMRLAAKREQRLDDVERYKCFSTACSEQANSTVTS